MRELGISLYFRQDRIRMRYRVVEELDYPEYIHLRINEEKKQLFIEKCDRDMDAFRILYNKSADCKKIKDKCCYIHAKRYLEYLAGVIGVPIDSPSLSFKGSLMPDGTIFIDLNQFEIINHLRIKTPAAAEAE